MQYAVPIKESDAVQSKHNVLFITRKWGPAVGGMETYCERLTEELAKLQPVEIIALKGRSNGQPPSALSLLLFPFTVLRRLLSMKARPATVHLGDLAIWPLGLLAWAFFPKAQMVLSAHGTDVAFGARGGLFGTLYSVYLKIGSALLKKASVIANSRATSDRLSAIGWRSEAVVPLATDFAGEICRDYDPKQILFAGRLVTRKGCGWFIREVLPLLPNHRLTVIGTAWDPSESAELENDRVEFLGAKPQIELARYFAKAGIVIVPNITAGNGEYEGFGLVAPEAASAGGLVVAANIDGLRDAVIDKETGFLITPGDAKAWAEKIEEISEWSLDERLQFVARSQETTKRHFNWARVAKQTAEAYRDG